MKSKPRSSGRRALVLASPFLATLAALACLDSSSGVAKAQQEEVEAAMVQHGEVEKEFEDFDRDNFDRSTNIDNEWLPLEPGTQFVYEGTTVQDGESVHHRLVVTVTDLTKVIGGVPAVVIWEQDIREGELIESELAFRAQDNEGNVWHLGEYREVYDEVEFVGGRAWMVGHLEGARAGIMMQAEPLLGTPSYSQGYAPPPYNWTDRGRVTEVGQKVCVPVDCYEDVLVTGEFNREEPGAVQLKYYARGVALIRVGWTGDDQEQETLELVELLRLSPEALDEVRAEALKLEERAYVYGSTTPAERTPGPE